jgi:hypothetical protein
MFHVINTLFPVALMAVLIAMVFKLSVDSGEKIGFSLTVLLAYAVYLTMISDNIPSTSVTASYHTLEFRYTKNSTVSYLKRDNSYDQFAETVNFEMRHAFRTILNFARYVAFSFYTSFFFCEKLKITNYTVMADNNLFYNRYFCYCTYLYCLFFSRHMKSKFAVF